MGQLAARLSEREHGKFPVNPRSIQVGSNEENVQEEEHEADTPQDHSVVSLPKESVQEKVISAPKTSDKSTPKNMYVPPIPYPQHLKKKKNDKHMMDILEMFKKVHINIPLLDAISQIPTYAKFLKELCTNKRKFEEHEKVMLSEEVSAVLQRKLPPKLKDPGSFSIPCTIGDHSFKKAILSSVNLMPYSIYEQLNLGELQETTVKLQLADRSLKIPRGIVEDVLVKVDQLILPADFFVLDMEEVPILDQEIPMLLGRPFMATAGIMIDVKRGRLTMEVVDQIVHQSFLENHSPDPIETCLAYNGMEFTEPRIEEAAAILHVVPKYSPQFQLSFEALPPSNAKIVPSIVKAPVLELKPFPKHLKYAYLGDLETLPVIIASNLSRLEEEKLLRVLKDHKAAIGWSIADIRGISPTKCMHRILLKDESKPSREEQRRLNPHMKEVKSGITVVKNDSNELVPQRVITGWRVCIDYRKLNASTRKDHFPLPFIDQMLERLADHSHYCFLDGYSGYNQIAIALEDQEKTTFTCPFGTFAYRRMSFGLCNAPSTFQRCMLSIFSDMVERFIEVFMDDFSVFGSSFDECLHHLQLVLTRCEECNLVLNWEKCHFMVQQGIVLGHVVSHRGIEVDKAKVDLIAKLPPPTTAKGIRSFLGHAGFYRRFIKDFSRIAKPLCDLLAKDATFCFNDACLKAFNTLKELLTKAPIIMAPSLTKAPIIRNEPCEDHLQRRCYRKFSITSLENGQHFLKPHGRRGRVQREVEEKRESSASRARGRGEEGKSGERQRRRGRVGREANEKRESPARGRGEDGESESGELVEKLRKSEGTQGSVDCDTTSLFSPRSSAATALHNGGVPCTPNPKKKKVYD
ncbi:PREDICTED: uncharacterized protein LOC101311229 [Fragaria vesca subsp. vesca]